MSVSADSALHRSLPQTSVFPVSPRSFRLLLSLPRRKNARHLRHRVRRSARAPARRKARAKSPPSSSSRCLQGAGGMIVHPQEFLQRVRQLCSEYGVLLIADEVLTGFGRCGKMFACELAGVVPDLMCLSKGITGGVLPLAATVCTDANSSRLRQRRSRPHVLSRPFLHRKSHCGRRGRRQSENFRKRAGLRAHQHNFSDSSAAPRLDPGSSRRRRCSLHRHRRRR